MMLSLSNEQIITKLKQRFADSVIESSGNRLLVKGEALLSIAEYLKSDPELDFDYLNHITAVDYYDYFELVYQLTSIKYNHSLVLKTQLNDRVSPVVSSLVGLWKAADFQEREIYDLMGISFKGHPNLKRIFLWEGFDGHPLRKDYL
jgi:NADH-quinone oxidoreductase subunit C